MEYLPSGDGEVERLTLLNKVYNSLVPWLKELSGKTVLTIGCGLGLLEHEMVKHGAKVIATDIAYLDVATKLRDQAGISSEDLQFRYLDLFTCDKLPKVDVIHVRFVLSHFSNRTELLNKLIKLAPDTGFLIEEIGPNIFHSKDPDYEIWYRGAQQQFPDLNVGCVQPLIEYLRGYKVNITSRQPICTGKLHALGVQAVLHKRPELLAPDLAVKLITNLSSKLLPYFTLTTLDFHT